MAEVFDTAEKADKLLNTFTGIYRHLAGAQYHASRQDGKSINESCQDVLRKIFEISTEVIGDGEIFPEDNMKMGGEL